MPRATNSTPNSDVLVDNTRRDVLIFHDPPPIPDHPEVFGGWYNDTPYRAPGQTGFIYQDSLSSVSSPGGSVEFHFRGTQIAVFGSIISFPANLPPAVSWYSVNGADCTKYTAPNVSETANGVNFYTSPEMPLDDHVLTINITTASSESDYYLDWIEYNVTARDGVTSQTSANATYSSVGGTSTSSGSALPTTQPVANAVHTKSGRAGAIAGGVIGGVALLLCSIFAILFWRRRKRLAAEIPKDYDYGPRGRPDTIPHVIAYDGQSLMDPAFSRASSPSVPPSMVERHPKLLTSPLPPGPPSLVGPRSADAPSPTATTTTTTSTAAAPTRPGRKGAKKSAPPSDVSSPTGSSAPQPSATGGGRPQEAQEVDHRRAMMEADPVFEEDAATDLPPAYVPWS